MGNRVEEIKGKELDKELVGVGRKLKNFLFLI